MRDGATTDPTVDSPARSSAPGPDASHSTDADVNGHSSTPAGRGDAPSAAATAGHVRRTSLSVRRVTGWAMIAGGVGVLILAGVGLLNALRGADGVVSRTSSGGATASDSVQPTATAVFAPNLLGLSEPAAVARLESLGISRDRIVGFQDSRTATAEIVVDQVPPSGEIITDTIQLTIAIPVYVMPDVVGLDHEVAAAIIGNAGLSSSTVSIEERPYGAPTGLVLSQSPPAGTVSPTGALLIVATVAPAPDLAGHSVEMALEMLEPIGAEVDLTSVELLDTPPNTVVDQSIGPGDPVTEPIELTISIEPPSISLASLGMASRSRCFVDDVDIQEVRYSDELYCRATENRDASASFDIAEQFVRLRLSANITDRSGANSGTVEIIGDGSSLERFSVSTGGEVVFDLDVRSMATLEFRVFGDDVRIAFLNARLYEPPESTP